MTPRRKGPPPVEVAIARVYDRDEVEEADMSFLVDRLWPRGLRKEDAPFASWSKDVAPSTELRQWYGHVPERFEEFARRYRAELAEEPACTALDEIRQQALRTPVVLTTATKDLEHSGATVLRDVLRERRR